MLRWRLVSASVIIAALVLLFWLDVRYPLLGTPGLWLVPLVALLAVLATGELLDLMKQQAVRPLHWPTYAGVLLVALSPCVTLLWPASGLEYPADCPLGKTGWPLAALASSLLLVLLAQMWRYRGPGPSVVQAALAMLAILYVGMSGAFLVLLRLLHGNLWGMLALLSMIVVVKISDTGAYFTGRLLGRHKMSPALSPGKTWEGTIGGVLAACLASWWFFQVLIPRLTLDPAAGHGWGWLPYGLLIALVGVVGDLAESMIKRDMARKDSSSWLPGLGGVLDVLDSILLAAAPAWLCWSAGLVGPS